MLCPVLLVAQKREPVSWTHSVEHNADHSFSIIFQASITQGWHIYSQYLPAGGPMPTRFTFNDDKSFLLTGTTTEHGNRVLVYDDLYEMDISHFEGVAQFKQIFRRAEEKPVVVHARVEYMACSDSMCIPEKQVFVVVIE